MNKKVGFIIARFQCAFLHEGHKALINKVIELSDDVIIFLGTTVTKNTTDNPLDYETRKLMVKSEFPNISIYSLPDKRKNEVWSENLDMTIDSLVDNDEEIKLYGSRDSFKQYYSGKYEVIELLDVAIDNVSGTQERQKIVDEHPIESIDYRKGLIASAYKKYPVSYATTDVCILRNNNTECLLGKKPGEDLYRWIGGYLDISDPSLELCAKREAIEECGKIELDNFIYQGSFRIRDFRYKNSTDSIMTTFFTCQYIYGHPKAGDDIEELKWFNIKELKEENIMEEHRQLLIALKENMSIELEIKVK